MSTALLDLPLATRPTARFGRVPGIVRALIAFDAAIIGISCVAFLVCRHTGYEMPTLLRLGQESNLPTWYSSFQLALVGLLLLPLAIRELGGAWSSWPLLAAALIFFGLSLDETAMLHERLGTLLAAHSSLNPSHGLLTGPSMLVVMPLAIGCFAYLAASLRRYWVGRNAMTFKLAIGLTIFIGSAGALELLSNLLSPTGLAIKLETLIEESGEMLGITLTLWGVLDLLGHERLHIELSSAGVTIR